MESVSNSCTVLLLVSFIPFVKNRFSRDTIIGCFADFDDTLQWNSPQDSSVAHVRGGLKFVDNTIYILTPGLYFVYCQILYNRVDPETEQGGQIASSYVMRHSIAYPPTSGILLKSRHTRYSREADRHSSYVGGLFFLHTGDQLSVQASKKSIISNDETASFFGLFKIGV